MYICEKKEKEETMNKRKNMLFFKLLFQLLQGALVGLGAVLPGISGGVLCVVFGIYKIMMEFLADPFKRFKTHLPGLIPYGIGAVAGFFGIANLISVLLEKYPAPSVCVFVGLITGMLPSLFREAKKQGKNEKSYLSMEIAMAVIFILLISLKVFSINITPGFGWYLFCGICLALSVIAPGMSFSTLLMPLGLYEPFVTGIGHFDLSVLIPGGIGAAATVILFAKVVNELFEHYYSVSFHAIIGVVIAATVMIIPVSDFNSIESFGINIMCIMIGIVSALALDKFNQKYVHEE